MSVICLCPTPNARKACALQVQRICSSQVRWSTSSCLCCFLFSRRPHSTLSADDTWSPCKCAFLYQKSWPSHMNLCHMGIVSIASMMAQNYTCVAQICHTRRTRPPILEASHLIVCTHLCNFHKPGTYWVWHMYTSVIHKGFKSGMAEWLRHSLAKLMVPGSNLTMFQKLGHDGTLHDQSAAQLIKRPGCVLL